MYRPYKEKYDAKYIEWLMLLAQDVVSLNAPVKSPVSDEQDTELGDLIEDTEPTPEELVIRADRCRIVDNYVNQYLNERENKIIRMRFGFDGDRPMSLEEVGHVLGITRERTRQIEVRALRKLRMAFAQNKITEENI